MDNRIHRCFRKVPEHIDVWDFSEELVKICQKNGLNVVNGDIQNIPFRDNIFNYTICIAVIHHLSTLKKRKKAVDEIIRITKKGGKITREPGPMKGSKSLLAFVEDPNGYKIELLQRT